MRCSGTKPNGENCRSEAMRGERYCYGHHPRYSERRHNVASKAGKQGGRGRPSRRKEIQEVRQFVKALAYRQATGDLSPSANSFMDQIISLLRLYLDYCKLELQHDRLLDESASLNTQHLSRETLARVEEIEEDQREKKELLAELTDLAKQRGIELPSSLISCLSKG